MPNSSVLLTKCYKTVTSQDTGMTDTNGNAAVDFSISGATPGYTVQLTVSVGAASVGAASCQTSFTPS